MDLGHRPACDKGPLLLCQICRSWRNLALATPYLWSSLFVTTSSNGQGLRPRIELIQLWLARSSAHPLSFSLDLDILSDYNPKEVLDLFSGHLSRWKKVKISLPARTLDLRLGGADTPQLEQLYLRCYQTVDVDVTLTSAPRLRNLFWAIGKSPFATQIPWSQLTSLSIIPRLTLQEVLYVFQHCPILEWCSLLHVDHSQLPEMALISELRQLTTLSLRSIVDASTIALAFSSLILPVLRDLAIRVIGSHWPHASFMSLLLRSQCSLTALRLSSVVITLEDFTNCLRGVTKTLETLEIVHHPPPAAHPFISDHHLFLLTYGISREYLCPKLVNLKLHRCLSSNDGAISAMVESRWNVPGSDNLNRVRLKTVDIIFLHAQEEDRAGLQQFQAEGLDVKMNEM
ncbi:hypothetical protein C8J57DRAFT_505693 [Mycena rebaudengoi]|nr:hypothetical protein C8J57DRAFT_505693 [Mycena rebaudengoi]